MRAMTLAVAVGVLLAACGGSAARGQSSPSPSALASATPITSPSSAPLDGGPLTWSSPVRVVHQPPYDQHILLGISCPTTTLCAAVDYTGGNVLTSSNPTGGPHAWTVTNVTNTGYQSADNRLWAVSCTVNAQCVAVDSSGHVITSSSPTVGAGAWTVSQLGMEDPAGASCPTADLCVVVGSNTVATSTTPLGPGTSWKVIRLSGANSLIRVSCPTVSLCVGVTYGGNAVTSTNPTGGAAAWRVTHIDGPAGCAPGETALADCSLADVSCPTTDFCAAVDGGGKVLVTSNPTGGSTAWRSKLVNRGAHDPSISCSGKNLCVVVDGTTVIVSSNPASAAPVWKAATVAGIDTLHGVSCASPSLCVAVEQLGKIVTSTNPTGGAAAWKAFSVIETNSLGHIACPAIQLCVATDNNGNIVSSTEPSGGQSAWSVTARDRADARLSGPLCFSVDRCVGTDYFEAIATGLGVDNAAYISWSLSCPAADLCVALGYGFVLTSANGGTSWTKVDFGEPHEAMAGLSCPTVHLCVVVDTGGSVAVSTNPAGGAAAWKWTQVISNGETSGVSCASETLCIVIGGSRIVTSSKPAAGAIAWTVSEVGRNYLVAVSCPANDLCVAIDDIGEALTSTNPTGGPTNWRLSMVDPGGGGLRSLACPSVSLCVAVDSIGRVVVATARPV
jgi:PQQ-like domain